MFMISKRYSLAKKMSTQFGKFHKTIDSKHNYVICLQKKKNAVTNL